MRKIVVAITGASGSLYASLLIEKLLTLRPWKTSLHSDDQKRPYVGKPIRKPNYKDLPLEVFETDDFMAPFASGSARYDTMIIIPCSMELWRIAGRNKHRPDYKAADVILKEEGN